MSVDDVNCHSSESDHGGESPNVLRTWYVKSPEESDPLWDDLSSSERFSAYISLSSDELSDCELSSRIECESLCDNSFSSLILTCGRWIPRAAHAVPSSWKEETCAEGHMVTCLQVCYVRIMRLVQIVQ